MLSKAFPNLKISEITLIQNSEFFSENTLVVYLLYFCRIVTNQQARWIKAVILTNLLVWKFYGNRVYHRVSAELVMNRLKVYGNCDIPQNFHTRKLRQISVFCTVEEVHCVILEHRFIQIDHLSIIQPRNVKM